MFDKRHYQNNPDYQKSVAEQRADLQRQLDILKMQPEETQEQLRKRTRSLGNKKTHNAKGRRWWDGR